MCINEHGINANRKIPKGFTTAKSKPVAVKEEPEELLYFENAIEFAMYVKLYNKKNNVVWVSSDKYIELYKKGYQLTKYFLPFKRCNISSFWERPQRAKSPNRYTSSFLVMVSFHL